MKARWMLLSVLLLAACDDSTGVQVPFTDGGGSVTTTTRAVTVRGLVSGPGGQVIVGATVRITATAVDANNICSGASTTVTVITGATGDYRVRVSVPDQQFNVCLTANVTPPAGSTLRASTVDLGRSAPVLETTGAVLPEVFANIQLTP